MTEPKRRSSTIFKDKDVEDLTCYPSQQNSNATQLFDKTESFLTSRTDEVSSPSLSPSSSFHSSSDDGGLKSSDITRKYPLYKKYLHITSQPTSSSSSSTDGCTNSEKKNEADKRNSSENSVANSDTVSNNIVAVSPLSSSVWGSRDMSIYEESRCSSSIKEPHHQVEMSDGISRSSDNSHLNNFYKNMGPCCYALTPIFILKLYQKININFDSIFSRELFCKGLQLIACLYTWLYCMQHQAPMSLRDDVIKLLALVEDNTNITEISLDSRICLETPLLDVIAFGTIFSSMFSAVIVILTLIFDGIHRINWKLVFLQDLIHLFLSMFTLIMLILNLPLSSDIHLKYMEVHIKSTIVIVTYVFVVVITCVCVLVSAYRINRNFCQPLTRCFTIYYGQQ